MHIERVSVLNVPLSVGVYEWRQGGAVGRRRPPHAADV